ncbi:MAG: hypothetical protein WB523_13530 [Candidatus Sulfotelmatobacter sp.]
MDRKDSNARYYEKHKEELRNSPARLAARQRYEAKRLAQAKQERAAKKRARLEAELEKWRRESDERLASELLLSEQKEAREREQRELRQQQLEERCQRRKEKIRSGQAVYQGTGR